MTTVIQLVRFDVNPEHREAVLDILRPHAALSRAEAGVLRYELAVDELDPGAIVIWEEFRDQAAVDAHHASPHIEDWRRRRAALPPDAIRGRTTLRLRPADR